jgi:hypothetical protein
MTQNEKLFTVAGTATQNGVTKARFANDMVSRVKILAKNGCTEINLVELPKPMTKLEALQYLQTLGITTGAAGEAISSKLEEKSQIARRQELSVPAIKLSKSKESAKTNVKLTNNDTEESVESQVESV